jgi:hypothetical protein
MIFSDSCYVNAISFDLPVREKLLDVLRVRFVHLPHSVELAQDTRGFTTPEVGLHTLGHHDLAS